MNVIDYSRYQQMSYIKGYKVDPDKVRAIHGTREQDPNNIDFLLIVEIFPRDSYLYIAAGQDLNGNYSLVVVLADGNNKSELEELPMPEFDLRGAGEIMTAGVWKKH